MFAITVPINIIFVYSIVAHKSWKCHRIGVNTYNVYQVFLEFWVSITILLFTRTGERTNVLFLKIKYKLVWENITIF